MSPAQISIMDFAIRKEEEGVTFYTEAAKRLQDPELRDLFLTLAKEEARHLEWLVGIQRTVLKKGVDECFRTVEVSEYLESIARDGVFPKGEDAARQIDSVKNVEDACKIALHAEKNAILLYSELAKLTRDREQKKIIERLIKEEKAHLAKVVGLRADHDPLYAIERFGKLC